MFIVIINSNIDLSLLVRMNIMKLHKKNLFVYLIYLRFQLSWDRTIFFFLFDACESYDFCSSVSHEIFFFFTSGFYFIFESHQDFSCLKRSRFKGRKSLKFHKRTSEVNKHKQPLCRFPLNNWKKRVKGISHNNYFRFLSFSVLHGKCVHFKINFTKAKLRKRFFVSLQIYLRRISFITEVLLVKWHQTP